MSDSDRAQPPGRPPPHVVLELHYEQQRIWTMWVEGEIPGYPDDETHLDAAQADVKRQVLERWPTTRGPH